MTSDLEKYFQHFLFLKKPITKFGISQDFIAHNFSVKIWIQPAMLDEVSFDCLDTCPPKLSSQKSQAHIKSEDGKKTHVI